VAGEGGDSFKVLAINGSHRSEKGITEIVMRRFLAGAAGAGAEVEVVYPAKMKIAPCLADFDCWFKTPGVCRHKDDMAALMKKHKGADLLVLATPVYVDSMSGYMKLMLERLVSGAEPFFIFDGKRTLHPKTIGHRQKVVVISTCAFPERSTFDAVSLTFKKICENLYCDLIAELYFPGSMIFGIYPERVESQMDAVELAGREAVDLEAVSEQTLAAVNRDYVGDPEAFDEEMNKYFNFLIDAFQKGMDTE
jgi:NAD(P)H-dependent FMN reductase